MNEIATHVGMLQVMISFGAGLLGVGIGIGMFKSVVNQVKLDLVNIKKRQARLRGEDNGALPVFRTRLNCDIMRAQCGAAATDKMQTVVEDLTRHTKSIRALDNFARWWMQKEGLQIDDINKILGDDN